MPTKLTVEELEKRFSEHGWELLEKEAKGVMASYLAKCPCGNITRKCPREIINKSGCVVCRNRAIAKKQSIGIQECRRVFESNGFTLLETSYKNVNTPMLAICSCGEQTRMTLKSVRSGCKCVRCGYKNRKVLYGKDNPAYNPNLSDEERNTDRRMPAFKEWSLAVKKRGIEPSEW